MTGGHTIPGTNRYFSEKEKKKNLHTHPSFKPLQFSHIETQTLLFLDDHLIVTQTYPCQLADSAGMISF